MKDLNTPVVPGSVADSRSFMPTEFENRGNTETTAVPVQNNTSLLQDFPQ
jgi:hypothetical protein